MQKNYIDSILFPRMHGHYSSKDVLRINIQEINPREKCGGKKDDFCYTELAHRCGMTNQFIYFFRIPVICVTGPLPRFTFPFIFEVFFLFLMGFVTVMSTY